MGSYSEVRGFSRATGTEENQGSYNIHTLNMSRPRDACKGVDEDSSEVLQVTNDEGKGSGRSDSNSDAPGKI